MRKFLLLLISLVLLVSFGACSKEQKKEIPEQQPEQQNEGEQETELTETKTLVLYFSRVGEQYNVGVIDKGNTAIVAEMIAEETGADMFEIIPEDDHYPMTYDALLEVAQTEKNEKARPAYKGEINVEGYDVIFIGSPVWWGDWPMIMYTVFENVDLSNKTLVPFSTHEGSGLSGFDSKLKKTCPDSTVLEGIGIRGADAQNNSDKAAKEINNWLNKMGY